MIKVKYTLSQTVLQSANSRYCAA